VEDLNKEGRFGEKKMDQGTGVEWIKIPLRGKFNGRQGARPEVQEEPGW